MTSIRRLNIMVSSTRADLQCYRDKSIELIDLLAREKRESLSVVDITMEKENASGEREFAIDVSKRWVEKADWVVLIVGFYYGTVSDEPVAGGLSVTEWEYHHAIEKGKRVFVFMAGDLGTTDAYHGGAYEENLSSRGLMQNDEPRAKAKNSVNGLARRISPTSETGRISSSDWVSRSGRPSTSTLRPIPSRGR